MKKRKVVLRLDPDEVAIVGTIEQWRHLADLYRELGNEASEEDRANWHEASLWVEEYLQAGIDDSIWDEDE